MQSKNKFSKISLVVEFSALAALLTILLGEYLNAFSQYPYFVVALPHIINKIPEPWRTLLARAFDLRKTNPLTEDPMLIVFTAISLIALLAAAVYSLYTIFYKKKVS